MRHSPSHLPFKNSKYRRLWRREFEVASHRLMSCLSSPAPLPAVSLSSSPSLILDPLPRAYLIFQRPIKQHPASQRASKSATRRGERRTQFTNYIATTPPSPPPSLSPYSLGGCSRNRRQISTFSRVVSFIPRIIYA